MDLEDLILTVWSLLLAPASRATRRARDVLVGCAAVGHDVILRVGNNGWGKESLWNQPGNGVSGFTGDPAVVVNVPVHEDVAVLIYVSQVEILVYKLDRHLVVLMADSLQISQLGLLVCVLQGHMDIHSRPGINWSLVNAETWDGPEIDDDMAYIILVRPLSGRREDKIYE